jgi:hypothetical protein
MPRPPCRSDLIALVAKKAPQPACRRACLTGKVELLGGFTALPHLDLPGWIFEITAKHGTVFHIAVVPDHNNLLWVSPVDSVPWHLWAGRAIAGEGYSIYSGDRPAVYDVRRDTANLKRGQRRTVLL